MSIKSHLIKNFSIRNNIQFIKNCFLSKSPRFFSKWVEKRKIIVLFKVPISLHFISALWKYSNIPSEYKCDLSDKVNWHYFDIDNLTDTIKPWPRSEEELEGQLNLKYIISYITQISNKTLRLTWFRVVKICFVIVHSLNNVYFVRISWARITDALG